MQDEGNLHRNTKCRFAEGPCSGGQLAGWSILDVSRMQRDAGVMISLKAKRRKRRSVILQTGFRTGNLCANSVHTPCKFPTAGRCFITFVHRAGLFLASFCVCPSAVCDLAVYAGERPTACPSQLLAASPPAALYSVNQGVVIVLVRDLTLTAVGVRCLGVEVKDRNSKLGRVSWLGPLLAPRPAASSLSRWGRPSPRGRDEPL